MLFNVKSEIQGWTSIVGDGFELDLWHLALSCFHLSSEAD